MDAAVQRALNDKLYDKRKVGALEWVTLSLSSARQTAALPVSGSIPGRALSRRAGESNSCAPA